MDKEPSIVIAVVGATGTGKSAAAVSLALQLGGEVINADAMQLYRGLDIASARISDTEMKGVRHHLLGVYEPTEVKTIHDYVDICTSTIAEIQGRGRVPILVGGTNLYIEKVLFRNSLFSARDSPHNNYLQEGGRGVLFTPREIDIIRRSCRDETLDSSARSEADSNKNSVENKNRDTISEEYSLYSILLRHDPETAALMHPNDSRRISRALHAMLSEGKKHSDMHEAVGRKRSAEGTRDVQTGAELRYPGVHVCVIDCDSTPRESDGTLAKGLDSLHVTRLNSRVDGMISSGLISEVYDMITYLRKMKSPLLELAQPSGCLQTIGFKEFYDYITAVESTARETFKKSLRSVGSSAGVSADSFNETEKEEINFWLAGTDGGKIVTDVEHQNCVVVPSERLEALRAESIRKTKTATRQYAKRQLTWIRNRLIPSLVKSDAMVHRVNSADLSSFEPQISLIVAGIAGKVSIGDQTLLECPTGDDNIRKKRLIFQCNDCGGQNFQGQDQYDIHRASKKHKKRVASLRKRLQRSSTSTPIDIRE